jgi:hypothetical protein
MSLIEELLKLKIKPKEKQVKMMEAVIQGKISAEELISYFKSSSESEKGTCADVISNVSKEHPEIFSPYIDILIEYTNYKSPRVKWGMPEAIGYIAKKYPDKVTKAIPYVLKNTTDDKNNTTVVKWSAAFALTEIAKNNPQTRKQLLPVFERIINSEANNGVKNIYLKAIKAIMKEKK